MLVRRASSRFIQGRDSFGILNTVALDDQVDAQPLVVSGQTINGHGIHNATSSVIPLDLVRTLLQRNPSPTGRCVRAFWIR